jgi:NIMA-interacting peptidyl-prolyl cis-trans isomerase 1
MSAASVRCSHILVKHTGSRRPSSWRCPTVTLTKAQAIEKLTKIREGIVAGAAVFEAVARVESDCSSAEHGGDLGAFTRGKMQKPFEDASFGLQVGELSGIVVRGARAPSGAARARAGASLSLAAAGTPFTLPLLGFPNPPHPPARPLRRTLTLACTSSSVLHRKLVFF